jgi:hypothetical protein
LYSRDLVEPTVAISDLRDKVDGTADKDQPIIGRKREVFDDRVVGQANLVPLDRNGMRQPHDW